MKKEVSIYMSSKLRSVELVVPEELVGDFIVQFGIKFGHKDMGQGFTEAKVDDYFYHPNGWHVSVSVDEKRVEKLATFIAEFSAKHELPFDSGDLIR